MASFLLAAISMVLMACGLITTKNPIQCPCDTAQYAYCAEHVAEFAPLCLTGSCDPGTGFLNPAGPVGLLFDPVVKKAYCNAGETCVATAGATGPYPGRCMAGEKPDMAGASAMCPTWFSSSKGWLYRPAGASQPRAVLESYHPAASCPLQGVERAQQGESCRWQDAQGNPHYFPSACADGLNRCEPGTNGECRP